MQIRRMVIFDITTKSRKKALNMVQDYIAIARAEKLYSEGVLLTVIGLGGKK